MEDNKIAPANDTFKPPSYQDELEKNVYNEDEYRLATLGYKQGRSEAWSTFLP